MRMLGKYFLSLAKPVRNAVNVYPIKSDHWSILDFSLKYLHVRRTSKHCE